jgi:hypothetical protein
MEQKNKIDSSLQELSLIYNLPVTFSLNNRRDITFRCPSIGDLFIDKDLKKFLGYIALTPEKIKESKNTINLPFKYATQGDIVKGLITFSEFAPLLAKYFLKCIDNSEYKERDIYVDNVKILSEEFDYIAKVILVSLNQITYDKVEIKPEEEKEKIDPMFQKILDKQKEAEDKLKKVKAKKDKSKGLSLEQIMLAISYEFHMSPDYLLKLNYFGLVWYFGYVGKVDAHKLNQMILSSGMSKQKNYSYWLNK